jgi:hypothetical protein
MMLAGIYALKLQAREGCVAPRSHAAGPWNGRLTSLPQGNIWDAASVTMKCITGSAMFGEVEPPIPGMNSEEPGLGNIYGGLSAPLIGRKICRTPHITVFYHSRD